MIVDYHRGNINLRYRDTDGNRLSETHTWEPCFYVDASDAIEHERAILSRFRSAKIDDKPTVQCIYTKKWLTRITTNQWEYYDVRKWFSKTWHADIPFADQFLIQQYDSLPRWEPRKCWFDIEWNPDDDNDFTQCWNAIDSYTNEEVSFAWRENQDEYVVEQRDGYTLHIFCSEDAVHEAVIQYIEDRDFDILIAHAAMWADIPHMTRRFKNANRLSPLGHTKSVKQNYDGYRPDDQPITGRLVFDTAAPGSSGTGFERVWMDSGNGQFPSRKLGEIGVHLGLGEKDDVDLTNDWRENFYRLTDYCMQDVRLTRDIDEYLRASDFFHSMQMFCGVSFTSTFEVGKFARGLVNRRTQKVFPSRDRSRRRERGDLQGATVMDPVPGLHEGVAVLDFKGLYPSIMTGDNLCWTTHRDEPSATTRTMPNGTHWEQEQKGILPEVVDYLFEERQILKDSGEKILEKAVKRVMASLYGLTAESLGHGMADIAIADTILSNARHSIDRLRHHSSELGYPVLFGHTDSCFVQCSLESLQDAGGVLTDIIQKETGNDKLIAEPEAWMPYWFCGDVKNRYAGIMAWPESDVGKLKVSGFEMKHSSTPLAIRVIQKQMLMMVGSGATETEVTAYISGEVAKIRDGRVPVDELSYSTRLSKKIEADPSTKTTIHHYPKTAGGYAKAARYYNWYMEPNEPYRAGDSVKWTYVSGVPDGIPKTDVIGYRNVDELNDFQIDTEGIIKKLVMKKIRLVYDIMDWDIKKAVDKYQPKVYW